MSTSRGQRFPRFELPEATSAPVDISPIPNEAPKKWRRLLSPSFLESGVLVADIVLILTAGLISSVAYQWVASSSIVNIVPNAGIGVIVAANFAASHDGTTKLSPEALDSLFPASARDGPRLVWNVLPAGDRRLRDEGQQRLFARCSHPVFR